MTTRTFPYSVSVTLLQRVLNGQDEFGNDAYEDNPIEVDGCVVQPSGSSEIVQWTDQVSSDIVVFFPYGTAVSSLDAILYNGIKYEIQGIPQNWQPSPFSGNTSPIQARASMVTGASV